VHVSLESFKGMALGFFLKQVTMILYQEMGS
jgi:hypothetical protein